MNIKLRNLKENALMELFSTEGVKLYSNSIDATSKKISIPFLIKGEYILRIKNKSSVSTLKLSHR